MFKGNNSTLNLSGSQGGSGVTGGIFIKKANQTDSPSDTSNTSFVKFLLNPEGLNRSGMYVSGSVFVTGSLNVSDVINSAGDVVAYYTSDERLKSNIKTINKPIYKLKQLRGVEYEWNGLQNTYASGSKDSGIIAQDVQKVLPQLVKERDNGYLGVRHDRLVGLLVEAIKEQQEQIDELKTEVKELKNGSSF